MALITEKAIVLLLVISFVQIVHLQARHTEYVFGPREHLDSGQDFGESSFLDFEVEHDIPSRDNEDRVIEFLNSRNGVGQNIQEIFGKNEERQLDEDGDVYDYLNDYDDLDDYFYDSDDYLDKLDELLSNLRNDKVPLKRIKRRIIPIGGGALDRGRSDRTGGYGRSRSPWAQPPRTREPVPRRSGPTGSAALFSLFPDLAPPEWKASRGIKSKKKKKSVNKEKDGESNKSKVSKEDELEEKTQRDEPPPPESSSFQKRKATKKKTKISKKEKEEIAKFAESHGVERAVSHFKSRVNAPLKANAVEKFLRRYKNRMERRASRS